MWWEGLPDMSTGRFGSAAINIPELGVLVLGGQGVDAEELNTVELFQISAENSVWCSFTPMLKTIYRPVVDFFQGCVYVVGSQFSHPQTAEFLSITNGRQGQWTLISKSLSTRRYLSSMLAFSDHLYIVAEGGNVYELETSHEENVSAITSHSILN
ncbi:unnamed protein product [Rodentolepis nana]|uniref:Kelch repeat protein n=1 Tax=Rodentolepis nana TaxID=102285 RepID=A0A0R3T6H4_RODNA|nr:unnamed protein product [Rodentolepis nana]